jgi:hypothetical protein
MNIFAVAALIVASNRNLPFMRFPRRYILSLSPYTCLLLVGVPVAVVEPLKLATVFIFGSGHWMTGSIVLFGAYALSVVLVERIFKIVKPKLLTLWWFEMIWTCFVSARNKAFHWLPMNWTRRKARRGTA